MSLRRAEILKSVVSKLRGRTECEDRVFPNRSSDPEPHEFPCILVNYRSEDTEELQTAPKLKGRNLLLGIAVVASGETEIEASGLMDVICEQVETSLTGPDDHLGFSEQRKDSNGKACWVADIIELDNVQFDFTSDGQKPVAAARLNWVVKYDDYFPRSRQGQKVNDFLRAYTDWDVNTANDPDPEAQDQVDLPGPE